MKVIIATQNAHKLKEIQALLKDAGVNVVGASELPNAPSVEEDGSTFAENAVKKAVTLARFANAWALADDSGLEVEALGGIPGVHSARYAGEPVKYAANNKKLLGALLGETNRRARFRCVIALASPSGETRCVEGTCSGVITEKPRGRKGFGYDPIFQPDGHTQTFAEMDAETKNRISHRARALAAAKQAWGALLAGNPSGW